MSDDSIVVRLSKRKFLRECIGRPFLAVNEWVWKRLPASFKLLRPVRSYGGFLQSLVRLRTKRTQFHGTFFFRNRPALQLICSLVTQRPQSSKLDLAVVGCSNGAEVYSILWAIRSARPDLELELNAIDISEEIIQIARKGIYSLGENPLVQNAPIMERLNQSEMATLFDSENGSNQVQIRPWISRGIRWHVADANDENLLECFEPADIIVANNFLCHMAPSDAEKCLRNLARFVRPGGYIFVSGVDLDVRTRVAIALGWTPVPDLIEEIHNGDPCMLKDWPWQYWGLEPFDPRRSDWKTRYAAFFKIAAREDVPETVSLKAQACAHENCGTSI